MTDTAARLAISARRNEVARFTIAVSGIDMTGVNMAMQIRLGRDVPGAPLISLETVTTLAAEGLKMDSVTVIDGIPTSIIKGRINASTMTDPAKVPYMGEIGTDSVLAYAMQWTLNGDPQTRVYGDFVVLGSAFNSDNAPSSRPQSYGGALSYSGGVTSGALTFGDQIIRVAISDAEVLGAIVLLVTAAKTAAEDARDEAQGWAETAEATAVPLAGVAQAVRAVPNDLTPAAEALDVVDTDGRVLFALGGGGLPREAAGFAASIGGAAGVNNTLAAIAALPRHGRLFTSVDWWGLTIAGQSNGASQSGSVLPTPPSLGNKRLVGNALVDIVETANESCATGAANHATDALLKRLSPLPQSTYPQQWVVFNMSQGGAAFSDIKKGTSAYNAGLAAVQSRRDLAVAAGKTYAERALVFIHGETDSNAGRSQAAYFTDLIQYKNDWNADVAAITGQTDRIPMFIVQVAIGDAFSTTSGPSLAMLQAAESDTDCFLVSAAYALTFIEDGLHATSHDQRGGTGERIGKALHRFYIDGKNPGIVRPISWKLVDPRTIDVEFYVPVPPLFMDIDHVWPGDAGMGFAVYDSTGPEIPVIGARVYGASGRVVRITTGADVSLTDRITYAVKKYTRALTGGIGAGRRKGARGCLRDSDLTAALYRDAKGRPYPLHNWCAEFDKVLETRA